MPRTSRRSWCPRRRPSTRPPWRRPPPPRRGHPRQPHDRDARGPGQRAAPAGRRPAWTAADTLKNVVVLLPTPTVAPSRWRSAAGGPRGGRQAARGPGRPRAVAPVRGGRLRGLPDAGQGLHRAGRAGRGALVGHPLPPRPVGGRGVGLGDRCRRARQARLRPGGRAATSPPTGRSRPPRSARGTRARTVPARSRSRAGSRWGTSSSSAASTPRRSDLKVLDENGKLVTVTMGSYGVGVSRAVAPSPRRRTTTSVWSGPRAGARRRARRRHRQGPGRLRPRRGAGGRARGGQGLEVIFDDRPKVSPGVKFKDAELLGVPTIVVVGQGPGRGHVEVKDRRSGGRREVPVEAPSPRSSPRCGARPRPRAAEPTRGGGDARLEPRVLVLLALAGLAAGFIDAVVGGGGLVQLPALLVGLPGASPVQLLATNKLGSICGTTTSSLTYLRRVRPDLRTALPLAGAAFCGSAAGAALAFLIPRAAFNPLILSVLVASASTRSLSRRWGRCRRCASATHGGGTWRGPSSSAWWSVPTTVRWGRGRARSSSSPS